jgi:protein-tyrosine kinase
MGRIDEALKRASEGPGSAQPQARNIGRTPRRMGDFMFDPYPSEPDARTRTSSSTGDTHVQPDRMHTPLFERTLDDSNDAHVPAVNGDTDISLVGSPTVAQVERYRSVAGTLQAAQVDRGLRTVTITSAVPGEGRTITAINLALTLTDVYACRVLLLDADRRQPAVHDRIGIHNYAGLSEALRGEGRRVSPTSVTPLLSVLTAGHAQATPFDDMTLDRMRTLLEEYARQFDWVVLDAPPVGIPGTDTRLLVRLTQAAIFVIGAGATPFPVVERAIGELGRNYVLATVMHGIDVGAGVAKS